VIGRWTVWRSMLLRYLGVSLPGHLIWETLQLPLYTLWTTGTFQQKLFAVLHCCAGDIVIAALSLLAALIMFAPENWPNAGGARVWAASLALGLGYTLFSEWLNTSVRGNWAYADLMPVVPVTGTGLAPLLQWIVVPTLAMWMALGRAPWRRVTLCH
jgi:hypothetical protein